LELLLIKIPAAVNYIDNADDPALVSRQQAQFLERTIMAYNRWKQEVLLHYHGDGAKALMPALPRLFKMSGKPYPFTGDFDNQCRQVEELFANPQIDIVKRFANTTGVMQSRETLMLATMSWVRELAKQGYKYVEVTIAPQYHTFEGLSFQDVVAALIEGIKKGEAEYPGIEVNLLITFGREISPELAVCFVDATAQCDRKYAVGIDLACDENFHPPIKHIKIARRAKKLGFKLSLHAGEWASCSGRAYVRDGEKDQDKINRAEREKFRLLQNIAVTAMILKADHIGHAIALAECPELVEYVVENKIGIEWCPGSNLTSGLIPDMSFLKIRDLLHAGVLGSVHPDDDLFLPDQDKTFQLLHKEYDFSEEELNLLNRNAWLTRFGSRKFPNIPQSA
jgi:adenosine deaminase